MRPFNKKKLSIWYKFFGRNFWKNIGYLQSQHFNIQMKKTLILNNHQIVNFRLICSSPLINKNLI